jgi:heat-inducible transcriptional repressor
VETGQGTQTGRVGFAKTPPRKRDSERASTGRTRSSGPSAPTPGDSKTSAHRTEDASDTDEGMLDERKAAILNAVVSEYVETAQPVGSTHVIGTPGVEVSSATVRSEMAALESEGYLVQPHTSAGRIPTDKGYRFFVDHLSRPGFLDSRRRQEVRRFFAHVHGEVEDLLGKTSGLLARLTNYAAVIVSTGHSAATIRSLQIVGLGPRLGLLLVVLSDGGVEKTALELPADTSEALLGSAAVHLDAHLRNRVLGDYDVPKTGDPSVDVVVDVARKGLRELGSHAQPEHVFVEGSSSMAVAFDAVEQVRSVLSILEQQLVVVGLIEQVLDRGLSVAIGTEHGFEPLASCALVVAPLSVAGEQAGTIGVLGPTRMRYPRALAAVQVVGDELSEHLSASSARSSTSSPPPEARPADAGAPARRAKDRSSRARLRGERGGS